MRCEHVSVQHGRQSAVVSTKDSRLDRASTNAPVIALKTGERTRMRRRWRLSAARRSRIAQQADAASEYFELAVEHCIVITCFDRASTMSVVSRVCIYSINTATGIEATLNNTSLLLCSCFEPSLIRPAYLAILAAYGRAMRFANVLMVQPYCYDLKCLLILLLRIDFTYSVRARRVPQLVLKNMPRTINGFLCM